MHALGAKPSLGRYRVLGLLFLLLFEGAWAQSSSDISYVKVALEPVYHEPDSRSEQVTQLQLWDAVVIEEVEGDWTRVRVRDQYRTEGGYPGWLRSASIARSSSGPEREWVSVDYSQVALRKTPSVDGRELVTVRFSTRLPIALDRAGLPMEAKDDRGEIWSAVMRPGAEQPAWVRKQQVRGFEPLEPGRAGPLIERVERLSGTPYLWGGMTCLGIDCSGLVYTVFRHFGWTLPRDADEQFEVGVEVSTEELAPGDLVFFGSPSEITHVGIYKEDGEFLHASSGRGVISSPLFEGYYLRNYRGARRILTHRLQTPSILDPGAEPRAEHNPTKGH